METTFVTFVRRCAACGTRKSAEVKLQKCAKCTSVRYCSRTCQTEAWSVHKPRCKEITARREEHTDIALLNDLFEKGIDYLKCNDMHKFKTLINENPALLNFQDEEFDRMTLLSAATSLYKPLGVSYLIHKKADVSLQNNMGFVPLHYACVSGEECYKMLLDVPADVNLQTKYGYTALYIASQFGHIDIVKMLLDRHADINLKDNLGATCLHIACFKGHKDTVELLLDRQAHINSQNVRGFTPLLNACQIGNIDIVRMLLDRQADTNLLTDEGGSPLHLACQYGHEAVAKVLLDRQADVDLLTVKGYTPLYLACHGGHKDIVKMLLDKQADVFHLSDNGGTYTPLDVARVLGHTEIVSILSPPPPITNYHNNNHSSIVHTTDCRLL